MDSTAQWAADAVIDGRYVVLGTVGVGGFGVVYRVLHLGWGSDLAVKSPRMERWDEASRAAFVAQAETWVKLGLHPNICICHYVRVLDGVPRVFVEYVPNGSLYQPTDSDGNAVSLYSDDAGENLRRLLDLAIQIAWGLDHAHSRGRVHCDVKPANVLIDLNATAGPVAKVTDFGLANTHPIADDGRIAASPAASGSSRSVLVSDGRGLTRSMTPAHASPEQLAFDPMSNLTDVYSYASTILEMFTGEGPWETGGEAKVPWEWGGAAAFLVDHFAKPASERFTGWKLPLPRGLAALLERCLSPRPEDRPSSMRAIATALVEIYRRETGGPYSRTTPDASELLADEHNNRALSLLDLERAAEAEESFAEALAADPRHVEATYNLGLLRWRRGEITDEALLTLLETVGGENGDPWAVKAARAHVHLERGDLNAARELANELDAEPAAEHDATAVRTELASGRLADAECTGTSDLRWYNYTQRQPHRNGVSVVPPELDAFVSADGETALAACDGEVRLWDVRRGECLLEFDTFLAKGLGDLDEHGRYATTIGPDDLVRLWSVPDGVCLKTFAPGYLSGSTRVNACRQALSGEVVAAVTSDNRVLVWDKATGQVRRSFDGVTHFTWQHPTRDAIAISRNARSLIARADDRSSISLRVLDPVGGDLRPTIPSSTVHFDLVWLDEAGRRAVIADQGVIRIWDLSSGKCVKAMYGPSDVAGDATVSDDGRWALFPLDDHRLELRDLTSGQCLRTFRGHSAKVIATRIVGPDQAVTLSQDNTARWWRLPAPYTALFQVSRPRPVTELSEADRRVRALVAEANAAHHGERYARALALLTEARGVPGHERTAGVLAAWRALSQVTRRVGLRAAWPSQTIATADKPILSVDLSADGRTLAVSLKVTGPAAAEALGEAGRQAAERGFKPEIAQIYLVDVATKALRRKLQFGDGVQAGQRVKLSADGSRVMAANQMGEIGVWSTASGKRLGRLTVSTGSTKPRYTADGRRVLMISGDESLRLWDLESGQCLSTLSERGHEPFTSSDLWLDPDGHLAVSHGKDGVIRLWDVARGECVRGFRGHGQHVDSFDVSPDRRVLASCGSYNQMVVRIHDRNSGRPDDMMIRLWDTYTGRLLAEFDAHEEGGNWHALSARFTPDGRFLLTSAAGDCLVAWDVETRKKVHMVSEYRSQLRLETLTSDGCHVLAIDDLGRIRLWELDWALQARED